MQQEVGSHTPLAPRRASATRRQAAVPVEEPDLPHELRTSLAIITLISGNLDLLYERLDDCQRRKMVRNIRKHTQKLNDLIVEMLVEHGEQEPVAQ